MMTQTEKMANLKWKKAVKMKLKRMPPRTIKTTIKNNRVTKLKK